MLCCTKTLDPRVLGTLASSRLVHNSRAGTSCWACRRYVPFGPVAEVMPYLVRRAQENSAVLGIVPQEKAMIMAELRRRIFKA